MISRSLAFSLLLFSFQVSTSFAGLRVVTDRSVERFIHKGSTFRLKLKQTVKTTPCSGNTFQLSRRGVYYSQTKEYLENDGLGQVTFCAHPEPYPNPYSAACYLDLNPKIANELNADQEYKLTAQSIKISEYPNHSAVLIVYFGDGDAVSKMECGQFERISGDFTVDQLHEAFGSQMSGPLEQ